MERPRRQRNQNQEQIQGAGGGYLYGFINGALFIIAIAFLANHLLKSDTSDAINDGQSAADGAAFDAKKSKDDFWEKDKLKEMEFKQRYWELDEDNNTEVLTYFHDLLVYGRIRLKKSKALFGPVMEDIKKSMEEHSMRLSKEKETIRANRKAAKISMEKGDKFGLITEEEKDYFKRLSKNVDEILAKQQDFLLIYSQAYDDLDEVVRGYEIVENKLYRLLAQEWPKGNNISDDQYIDFMENSKKMSLDITTVLGRSKRVFNDVSKRLVNWELKIDEAKELQW